MDYYSSCARKVRSALSYGMTGAAFRRKSCRGSSSPFLPPRKRDAASAWDLPSATAFWNGINGNIEVQSEVGRGTTFTVTLPWDADKDANKVRMRAKFLVPDERNCRYDQREVIDTWKHKVSY